jgi:hypothetical protein
MCRKPVGEGAKRVTICSAMPGKWTLRVQQDFSLDFGPIRVGPLDFPSFGLLVVQAGRSVATRGPTGEKAATKCRGTTASGLPPIAAVRAPVQARLAYQGLSENENGCARISIMAKEHERSIHGPDTEAQDQSPPSLRSGLQHTAGPNSRATSPPGRRGSFSDRLRPGQDEAVHFPG